MNNQDTVYINQLNSVDSVNTSDMFVVFVQKEGTDRQVSAATFADFVQEQLDLSKAKQYSTPNENSFVVSVESTDTDTWLILTPTMAIDDMTLNLPATAIDQTQVQIVTTQDLTNLIVAGLTSNGETATIIGAPTSVTASGFFTMQYDLDGFTWYRVA